MARSILWCAIVAAGYFMVPAPAAAQVLFTDGFETYAPGTLPPQGGWNDFGGSQPITVSTTRAHTGANSMRLSEGTDTIGGQTTGYGSDVWRNFAAAPITGSFLNFSYWQFIDPGVDSVAFMFLSTLNMPAGTNFQTGLDLRADSPNAFSFGANQLLTVQGDAAPTLVAAPVPLVKGAWVPYNITVNLATNTYNFSYNGNPVVTGLQWDRTPGDGVSFGGLDFWMQVGNANAVNEFVYYDDFSLVAVPEPSSLLLAPIGFAFFKLMRRRRAAAAQAV